ncbi:MAG: phosphoribosylformylglycinamidine synthase subunit PurQ [Candidatus Omnitrophota bacterium]
MHNHRVKVLVLRTAGTNCDQETKFAFEYAGAAVELIHINALIAFEKDLSDFHILAIPGGFTYGDDVSSGKILANELRFILGDELQKFIEQGKLIIGICNGFQVLVKAGILPGIENNNIEATLSLNNSAKFEDRWVYLKTQKTEIRNQKLRLPAEGGAVFGGKKQNTGQMTQKCVWTQGLPETIYIPVAHAEGKFIPGNDEILQKLWDEQQVVFQYVNSAGKISGYPDNPNGSVDSIAGICNSTGRVLGLMPHPERHLLCIHHPQWTRINQNEQHSQGDGAKIFINGVKYAKKYL